MCTVVIICYQGMHCQIAYQGRDDKFPSTLYFLMHQHGTSDAVTTHPSGLEAAWILKLLIGDNPNEPAKNAIVHIVFKQHVEYDGCATQK